MNTTARTILPAILAALMLAVSVSAAAEEARPIPRIVVTAKRMTDAEKAREAAQERREAELAAQPAATKAVRNGKVG